LDLGGGHVGSAVMVCLGLGATEMGWIAIAQAVDGSEQSPTEQVDAQVEEGDIESIEKRAGSESE